MPEQSLGVLSARWELPSTGADAPKRQMMIDLAFRLAAIIQPGFAPTMTTQPISSKYNVDDLMGDSLQEDVCRLGDEDLGIEITDTVHNPNDGMVGISSWTGITVYGLPKGWALSLGGDFIAAQYGRPHPISLKTTLPKKSIPAIADLVKAKFGATVEEN